MGKIDSETILKRIETFLADEYQTDTRLEILQAAVSLMTMVYGPNNPQLKRLEHDVTVIHNKFVGTGVGASHIRNLCVGALKNLKAEIKGGLIGSIERQISGDVLTDFLLLSREKLDEKDDSGKNVAAVLIAALFERVLRRLCIANGIPHIEKLQDVITELKAKNVLVGPDVGVANGYLNFRNHALHGKWETIDRPAIGSIQAFTEQLLLKHFAG
jgi:hypothetical protein